ncbi:MAG: hypothetical protein ABR521_08025 [Gaiellaceae bacterium]
MGFLVGGAVGLTVLTVNVVGASVSGSGVPPGASADPRPEGRRLRDVLHRPPLLVDVGERVRLEYEVVCVAPGPARGFPAPCRPRGSVFVRPTAGEPFTRIPLAPGGAETLSATLPASFTWGAGFDYYALVEDGSGESQTLPAGAPVAAHRVWVVGRWTDVDLGTHVFGTLREPDGKVLSASWGRGAGRLGLDAGSEQARIGPSAFDVVGERTFVVLDQVNHRLAIQPPGVVTPIYAPIPFAGGEGDVAADGRAIHVLDQGGAGTASPAIRSFGSSGKPIGVATLAEPSADMLRVGPGGPLVHSYPSEMWLPTGAAVPLPPLRQLALARNGRLLPDGSELVVRAAPAEIRIAVVRGPDVLRSWRLRSTTSLGEVQLAEPDRGGLVAVVRVWSEQQAEFRVLQLTPAGLERAFDVDPGEWAEAAALSRFRLEGRVLYQLRSSPAGAEIVTFQIGGRR